ncbi:MAG: LysM peptidoglycan-binding domain-containing protein [Clostridia bacterium]|nr:LysM peptidoglycan-binding domain-containing protein [Clostridia bacterium]
MKKIYLCIGNINKTIIERLYNKTLGGVSSDKILDHYYYTIEDGTDDIVQVLNYNVPQIYKVSGCETKLDLLAKGYNVECDIEKGDTIVLNKDCRVKHVVKPLETIVTIASKYNKNIDEIILNNNIVNNKLYIGQLLYI